MHTITYKTLGAALVAVIVLQLAGPAATAATEETDVSSAPAGIDCSGALCVPDFDVDSLIPSPSTKSQNC